MIFWLLLLAFPILVVLLLRRRASDPLSSLARKQELLAEVPADAAPLYRAVERGDLAAVRELLAGGADPGQVTRDGLSPLGVAIIRDRTEVARALLEAGADPNAAAARDYPALLLAAEEGRDAVLPALLEAGAAAEYADPNLSGAVGVAIISDHPATALRLLDAGVPADVRNELGETALHHAAFCAEHALLEELLARPGVDVDDRTFAGETALFQGADDAEVIQLLLAAGADPAAADDQGRLPIDEARDSGEPGVVELLERAAPSARTPPPRVRQAPLARMLPPLLDSLPWDVRRGLDGGGERRIRARAGALVAPSLLSVFRERTPEFSLSWEADPGPDPRRPARAMRTQLWAYGHGSELGEEAQPALPAPADEVAAAVARVARYPYLLRVWSEQARRAAGALPAAALPDVLATMVHPVPGPTDVEPWNWRFRVQVAAALVASYLGDEPWEASRRREALEDVAEGPADWVSTAAVIALLDVTWRDAAAQPSTIEVLRRCAARPFNLTIGEAVVLPATCALVELGLLPPDGAVGVQAEVAARAKAAREAVDGAR